VSCGSLWGLSPFCRVHSIDVSSHRFRPSDHMCVNERSMVATISGGNNQWRRSLLCLDGCSLHAMTMLCYVSSRVHFPAAVLVSQSNCVCVCVCVCVCMCVWSRQVLREFVRIVPSQTLIIVSRQAPFRRRRWRRGPGHRRECVCLGCRSEPHACTLALGRRLGGRRRRRGLPLAAS